MIEDFICGLDRMIIEIVFPRMPKRLTRFKSIPQTMNSNNPSLSSTPHSSILVTVVRLRVMLLVERLTVKFPVLPSVMFPSAELTSIVFKSFVFLFSTPTLFSFFFIASRDFFLFSSSSSFSFSFYVRAFYQVRCSISFNLFSFSSLSYFPFLHILVSTTFCILFSAIHFWIRFSTTFAFGFFISPYKFVNRVHFLSLHLHFEKFFFIHYFICNVWIFVFCVCEFCSGFSKNLFLVLLF